MRRFLATTAAGLAACGLTLCAAALDASPALASTAICTGTPEAPGTLAGSYANDVVVEGECAVTHGPATVAGNLTLRPGAALVAAFALNHGGGTARSRLTVHGNTTVQSGATLIAGCTPRSFRCVDDPSEENPTLSSRDRFFGNITEHEPLAVIAHNSLIDGNVAETGGGGGISCEPQGIFEQFHSPVYSAYEDSDVHGNISVVGLNSCWLGLTRLHVGGNVRVINDKLADPDAIEILSNTIAGNLECRENFRVWDSAEEHFESLFPRVPLPNRVSGHRGGQCVHSSPETEGGPEGEGPF
jgi:hypothetical protein